MLEEIEEARAHAEKAKKKHRDYRKTRVVIENEGAHIW